MLAIWLPLTGTLDNQGLCGDKLTTSGTISYQNGKLGKALNTGSVVIPAETTGKILNNKSFSYCCWFCAIPGDNPTNNRTMIFGNDSQRRYAIFQYPTANDLHLSFRNEAATNTDYGVVHTGFFPSNTWVHLAVTYDGKTLKVYKNGNIFSTANITITATSFNYDTTLIHNSSYHLLNDVRLYSNHCLSDKEVKEISKGLVLHYKLSGVGQDNLATGTHDWSTWSVNGLFTKTGNYIKASRSDATSNLWNRVICQEKIDANNYPDGLTVSFDFKCDDINVLDHKCICALQEYNSQGTRIGWYESKNSFTETNYIGSSTLKNGEWKRLSCYFTNAQLKVVNGSYTSSDYSYTLISFQLVKNGTIYFRNPKIENGNVVTPWCPNVTDKIYAQLGLNSNIEYDCSGYKNNGETVSKSGVNLLKGSSFTFTSKPSDANWSGNTVNNISSSNFTTDGWHYTATATNGAVNSSKMITVKLSDLGLKYGDTITISYDLKGKFGTDNNGLTIFHATSSSTNFWTYSSSKINGAKHPATITNWTRIIGKWTIDSNFNSTSDAFYIAFGGGTGSEVDVYVKNVRIDFGDESFAYDTNINNYIKKDSDTPRYTTSYKLNGTNYIKSNFTSTMEQLSISFWVKPSSSNGTYPIICSNYNNPSGGLWIAINCENQSVWAYRGGYIDVSGNLQNDIWHHCVFTFDKGVSKWYINGQNKELNRNTYTGTTMPITNLSVANSYSGTSWNTRNNGNLSDFRVYATALSSDDVLELYNTSALITNTGIAMAYEFEEN